MRSTSIKTAIAISFVAIFSPQMASAATSPSFSCSSNLVVSLDNGYSASCDGDFSFTDGVLQNDTSISLTAGSSLSIGINASLSSPFIKLSSKDIFLDGVLNALGGQIVVSSTNSTIASRTALINVSSNLILQNEPQIIVDWNAFNLTPKETLSFNTNTSSIQLGGVLTNSGSTSISGNLIPSSGGSIVLSNTSGINLITNALNDDNSFSAGVNAGTVQIVSSVPEPSSYLMLLLGLLMLASVVRTKQTSYVF